MIPFIEQARCYALSHENPLTRYTHFVGVPLILFAFMVFLGFIHVRVTGIFDLSLATIATLLLLGYYFRLNWRLALAATPVIICLLWVAELVSAAGPGERSLWVFFVTLILGAGLQLLGHFFEGKRPAFMDTPWHIVLAPLYVTAEIIFLSGHMLPLKEAIHAEVTTTHEDAKS